MEVRCLNDEGTVESWLPARVLAPADNRGNYCIRLLGEDDTENRNDGDAPANAYNMEASELRPLFDPTESSGAANYVSSGDAAVEGHVRAIARLVGWVLDAARKHHDYTGAA